MRSHGWSRRGSWLRWLTLIANWWATAQLLRVLASRTFRPRGLCELLTRGKLAVHKDLRIETWMQNSMIHKWWGNATYVRIRYWYNIRGGTMQCWSLKHSHWWAQLSSLLLSHKYDTVCPLLSTTSCAGAQTTQTLHTHLRHKVHAQLVHTVPHVYTQVNVHGYSTNSHNTAEDYTLSHLIITRSCTCTHILTHNTDTHTCVHTHRHHNTYTHQIHR